MARQKKLTLKLDSKATAAAIALRHAAAELERQAEALRRRADLLEGPKAKAVTLAPKAKAASAKKATAKKAAKKKSAKKARQNKAGKTSRKVVRRGRLSKPSHVRAR